MAETNRLIGGRQELKRRCKAAWGVEALIWVVAKFIEIYKDDIAKYKPKLFEKCFFRQLGSNNSSQGKGHLRPCPQLKRPEIKRFHRVDIAKLALVHSHCASEACDL